MSTQAAERSTDLSVFISYRRSDCQAQANGLNDGLRNRLPDARIFMDIDSIPFGVDFEQHIRNEIGSCDVVLVLVGDNWLDVASPDGARRIDDPHDFVRLEIENALASPRALVIPVLVEDAAMPAVHELPKSIQQLARLNAIELSDRRWQADLRRLTDVVQDVVRHPRRQSEPAAPPTIRLDQVQGAAIAAAVAAARSEFQTKDVSEQAAAAHGSAGRARNYHAMVGSYISRNCQALGVRSLGKSSNGRGERWEKMGAAASFRSPATEGGRAPQPASATVTPPPSAAGSAGQHWPQPAPLRPERAPVRSDRVTLGEKAIRAVMIALPFSSGGLAAWVPPVWAAAKTSHEPKTARRLYQLAALSAALLLASFVCVGFAPVDEQGVSEGPLMGLFFAFWLSAIVLGTATGIVYRNVGIEAARRQRLLTQTPGVGQALAAREAREHYRQLAGRDPALAREMAVGRPDRHRSYGDGGLIDLNGLDAGGLVRFARLGPAEAEKVIEYRQRCGRLSSVDELVIYADVDPPTAEMLREYAVFL